ncbi:GM23864 [Drosophila sechellia]|uniref:Leishmanolysin-like peptidase n=1 Tax=Drosophila sechellia TaxID=7238 RepID=B4HJ88_DROSE|nr:GM23864 [Drosophila sechellia]
MANSPPPRPLGNMAKFLAAVGICSWLLVSATAHNCQHQHPKAHEVVHGVRIQLADSEDDSAGDPARHSVRRRSVAAEQPLRILLVYDESVYRLEEEKFNLINDTVLPEAVQFWEQALMVRETKGVIRLNRKCDSTQVYVKNGHTHCIDHCKATTMCGEVQVPDAHLDVCRVCNATGQNCRIDSNTQPGEGIENADFVFYVSARQTQRCFKGLTVAYAAHCQQEAALDRPIAGHANLCPESISTKPQELQTLISTVKHEILHALGFSVSLYAFFRDDEGKPRTPRKLDTGKPYLNEKLQIHQWSNETIRKVVRENWSVRGGHVNKVVDMMVTPRVIAEVRAHFNCNKLEGAELEDQGGEGTALTHWEKRILENEAMTGTHTQSPVFSRITLALMEDSGWYRANYSMATPLTWGKGMGCAFAMRSCKDWIQYNHASCNVLLSRAEAMPLRIAANGWLHKGTIMCPPCHELCGAQFAVQGKQCRPGEEPDPLNKYPRDNLACGAGSEKSRSVAIITAALLLFGLRWGFS